MIKTWCRSVIYIVVSNMVFGLPSVLAQSSKSIVALLVKGVANEFVAAPVHGETCFSPDDPCDIKLGKFLKSARRSIDVAIYDINLDRVVQDLLFVSKQIPVRILVDRRQAKGKYSQVPLLLKAGVNIRYGRQRGIMHNKFVIVDGKIVELGSFNFTNGAALFNNENQVYLADPSIVARYAARFQKIWAVAERPHDRSVE